jgi:hypothetical protein
MITCEMQAGNELSAKFLSRKCQIFEQEPDVTKVRTCINRRKDARLSTITTSSRIPVSFRSAFAPC